MQVHECARAPICVGHVWLACVDIRVVQEYRDDAISTYVTRPNEHLSRWETKPHGFVCSTFFLTLALLSRRPLDGLSRISAARETPKIDHTLGAPRVDVLHRGTSAPGARQKLEYSEDSERCQGQASVSLLRSIFAFRLFEVPVLP